jgi:hypothetical protein
MATSFIAIELLLVVMCTDQTEVDGNCIWDSVVWYYYSRLFIHNFGVNTDFQHNKNKQNYMGNQKF